MTDNTTREQEVIDERLPAESSEFLFEDTVSDINRRAVLKSVLAASLPVSGAASSTAPVVAQQADEDWPKFRFDLANTGTFPGASGPEDDPEVSWSVQTGGAIESSPAIAGGEIFVGSNDANVYAFDAKDGSEIWQFTTGGAVRSSPAVVNGTVYVGSDDNNVYALDAADGSEQWRFDTGGDIESSPAVESGTVFVGRSQQDDADDRVGVLYAIDAANGNKEWEYSAGTGVRSSPAVANDTVYVGSDGAGSGPARLHALNSADGSVRWKSSSYGFANVVSSPAVVNGIVFVGRNTTGSTGRIHAFDADTGNELWVQTLQQQPGHSSPAVRDGTVYIATDKLYALDPSDGSIQWTFQPDDVVGKPSVAVDDSTVYFGDSGGKIYAVDADDGSEQWSEPFEVGGAVNSSPAVTDGQIYVGSDDEAVHALEKTEQKVGPEAFYNFEGTGTTVVDRTGNDHTGELVRASRVSGRGGKVVEFDRANQEYARLGQADTLEPRSGPYTVSLWFKTNSDSAGIPGQDIFDKRGDTNQRVRVAIVEKDKPDQISFQIKDDPGLGAVGIVSENGYADGEWHHLVGVRDTDKSQLELYIDDELIGTTEDTQKDVNPNGPAYLGGRPERPNNHYYTGQIDDVKIWKAAIRPDEIGGQNQAPTADFTFTPEEPVVNEEVTFDATGSSDPDGSITSYEWDFDNDGTIDAYGETATQTFADASDPQVSLRVIDNNGAADTQTKTVSVLPNLQPLIDKKQSKIDTIQKLATKSIGSDEATNRVDQEAQTLLNHIDSERSSASESELEQFQEALERMNSAEEVTETATAVGVEEGNIIEKVESNLWSIATELATKKIESVADSIFEKAFDAVMSSLRGIADGLLDSLRGVGVVNTDASNEILETVGDIQDRQFSEFQDFETGVMVSLGEKFGSKGVSAAGEFAENQGLVTSLEDATNDLIKELQELPFELMYYFPGDVYPDITIPTPDEIEIPDLNIAVELPDELLPVWIDAALSIPDDIEFSLTTPDLNLPEMGSLDDINDVRNTSDIGDRDAAGINSTIDERMVSLDAAIGNLTEQENSDRETVREIAASGITDTSDFAQTFLNNIETIEEKVIESLSESLDKLSLYTGLAGAALLVTGIGGVGAVTLTSASITMGQIAAFLSAVSTALDLIQVAVGAGTLAFMAMSHHIGTGAIVNSDLGGVSID